MSTLIETKRLRLRSFRPEDIYDIHQYMSHPQVLRYIEEQPYDLEATKNFINKHLGDNPLMYAIVEKSTNHVVGHVIYHPYQETTIYELGWVLNESAQGHGYGLEISRELIHFTFDNTNAHKIYATTVEGNQQSIDLLIKLGFKKEGVLRKKVLFNDKYLDEYCFGLLKNESRQRFYKDGL